MNEKISQFKAGLKDGIPIGLGYLAVSFTFGIMAKGAGLTTLEAVVLSFTNLTSAGQFARPGDHYCRFFPCGNGYGTADHQPALLPDVLFSFPETGQSYAIFSPFSYVLRCNR